SSWVRGKRGPAKIDGSPFSARVLPRRRGVQATWLVPGGGITVAGQRRIPTGLRCTTRSGGNSTNRTYAASYRASRLTGRCVSRGGAALWGSLPGLAGAPRVLGYAEPWCGQVGSDAVERGSRPPVRPVPGRAGHPAPAG